MTATATADAARWVPEQDLEAELGQLRYDMLRPVISAVLIVGWGWFSYVVLRGWELRNPTATVAILGLAGYIAHKLGVRRYRSACWCLLLGMIAAQSLVAATHPQSLAQALFFPASTVDLDIWQWIANTLVRIAWYIVITGTVAVLAGYVFAKLRFRGRETAFMYLLTSMMIPGIVYWIPTYVMLARFPGVGGNDMRGAGGHGLIDSWPALLLTGWVNVYYIFLLRQTFRSIPDDFEEAARVDGATTLRCLKDVYLPMLKPTLTVLVIFQFVALWNDYQWPLIVSSGNRDIWTVALGFQRMLLVGTQAKGYPPGTSIVDYPFSFAMAVVATIPLVLLFLRLQSYFVEGVQGFAIKG